MSNRIWIVLAVFALLAGIGWRASHLDNRPLHADEAVQAWLTWKLLEGEGYRYDPLDRHGPSLYYGAAIWHTVTGGTAEDFDDRSARMFVLLAGAGTLALLAFGARSTGLPAGTGRLAAALLAFETLTTLYQTYFVQEAWLALFVWAAFFLILRFWRKAEADNGNAISTFSYFALGACIGLAQASKEITPIYLAIAAGAAWLACRPAQVVPGQRALLIGIGGFLLPVVLLYSSFGSNPGGLLDAVRTYPLQAARVDGAAHAYPPMHYIKSLSGWDTGQLNWGQTALLLFSLVGAVLSFRRSASPAARAIAIFTIALLTLHSAIPYKTPWLMVTPMIGLCLLAAFPLVDLVGKGRWGIIGAALVLGVVSWQNVQVGQLALDRYPGDARNPYFYVQTPRAFMRLPDRLNEMEARLGRDLNVAVVSAEHAWPLPWYRRHQENTGMAYFDQLPTDWEQRDVLVWDTQQGVSPVENDGWIIEYVGLRPGVLLEIAIRRELWDRCYPPSP